MIIKKYKIGNFTVEVNSQATYGNSGPFTLFSYDGDQTDYKVTVEFSSVLPQTAQNPYCTFTDRVCEYEKRHLALLL